MPKRKSLFRSAPKKQSTDEDEPAPESVKRVKRSSLPSFLNGAHEQESDADGDLAIDEDLVDNDENQQCPAPFESTHIVEDQDDQNPQDDTMNYNSFVHFMKEFELFSSDDGDDTPKESPVRNQTRVSRKAQNKNRNRKKGRFQKCSIEKTLCNTSNHLSLKSNYGEVVFFKHPSSVKLHGLVKVTLYCGKASIFGYELIPNKTVTVYSQQLTGLFSIQADEFERTRSLANFRRTMHSKLNMEEAQLKKFMKANCDRTTAIVLIERTELPPPLRFLQLYLPELVALEQDVISETVASVSSDRQSLAVNEDYESMFASIDKHFLQLNKKRPDGYLKAQSVTSDMSSDEDEYDGNYDSPKELTGCRILISGPKRAGKSTLLRYLINKFLNLYSEVYYLDTDPGQSEFTPPGGVSITRVTQPLLGPSYTHQQKPLKMIFTGTITAETSPPMHTRSIEHLMEYFNTNFPNSILLVNTMGWIHGLGGVLLELTKKYVNPTVEIEVLSNDQELLFDIENRLLKFKVGFSRDSTNMKGVMKPVHNREGNLLAYLGQCQQFFMQGTFINEMRPVCVSWDNIAVYNFNKRLPYNRFYEALNASIVALCHVEDKYMLQSNHPDYPNTLEDEPNNDCLGFGLVRAVDEEQHYLYIITPVEFNVLRKVNALIAGNVLIPNSLLGYQPVYDTELFYTDQNDRGQVEGRKPVKRRPHMRTPCKV